ncbi:hypothetical protein ALNOE001_04300 [Candidatus Methanobinarius endosymbioticus]|uniref:Uncharacterized protein n=1 Tax=Candidatus Methanobinarius endosymbioticus TaxID=2006182 RepID=A0A366MFA2_9EURY|nr:hypothetical protein ALNOE001_04300 [Candidatus Methanobinarius endosymbioticus]
MVAKDDSINIFKDIYDDEIDNGLKPEITNESDSSIYKFQESHYTFVNNVTISFDEVEFDDDNLRFYLEEGSVAGVAIPNIEELNI